MNCPRCKIKFDTRPAISRRDNRTPICPACGVDEALCDYYKILDPQKEWPIVGGCRVMSKEAKKK